MQSHPGFGDSKEVDEVTPGKSGCRKMASYSVEPGAVKLGDSPHSHIQVNFRRRNILQKDFALEVEFRTYYPDGLLFIVSVRTYRKIRNGFENSYVLKPDFKPDHISRILPVS